MIALLLPNLAGGGAERVSLSLARAFAGAGHRVEFVILDRAGELLAEAEAEFPVVALGHGKMRHSSGAVAAYLRRARPDAVIANMWPLTTAAVVGHWRAGVAVRLVLVEHNTLSNQYASWGWAHRLVMRASMRCTYRRADAVVAVSDGAARDTERLAGLAMGRVVTIHNPIPAAGTPDAAAIRAAASFWRGPPGQRLLTVGTLKEQKNHALLLRAVAQLAGSAASLVIVGAGDGQTALAELAADLGIADRVTFAGFHADPGPFYAAADLFVLSSDYEGFGNVIVEAMAQGLPVVSTDCPSGPAEILENGRFGLLTPVGDAQALARAMAQALASPVDRAAQMRRAADFAPGIAAGKYLNLLGLA